METLTFENMNMALGQLNAVDKGRYYLCDCPQCGRHEAYIQKKNKNFVNCNRKNNCGVSTRLQLQDEQVMNYRQPKQTLSQKQADEIKKLGNDFELYQELRSVTKSNDVFDFFINERQITREVLNSSNVPLMTHTSAKGLAELMPNVIDQKYNAKWAAYRNIIFGFKNPETNEYERLLMRTTNKNEQVKELQILLKENNAVTFTEFGNLKAEKVYIVESVIDGLSLLEVTDEQVKVIALSGVNGVNRLAEYMLGSTETFQGKQIHIVLDNDKAGVEASDRLMKLLNTLDDGEITTIHNATHNYPSAEIKDLNQFLQEDKKELLHDFIFNFDKQKKLTVNNRMEQHTMFEKTMETTTSSKVSDLTFENVKAGTYELAYTINDQLARQDYNNTLRWNPYNPENKDKDVIFYIEEFVDMFEGMRTAENTEKMNQRLQNYNKLIVELHERVYRANKIPSAALVGGSNFPTAKKEAQNERLHELKRDIYGEDGKRARFIDKTHKMFDQRYLARQQAKKDKKKTELDAAGLGEGYKEVEHNEIAGYGLDVERSRVYVRTHGKPSVETRTLLKKAGLRYSPTNTRWQRQITNNAFASLERFFSAHNLTFDVNELKQNNQQTETTIEEVKSQLVEAEDMMQPNIEFNTLMDKFRGDRSKENAQALFDELTAGVKKACADPKEYKALLLYASRLGKYSERNQMLLYNQMNIEQRSLPIMNTFKGWKEQGVQVQKGSKAFGVLHPKPLSFFQRNGENVLVSKATAAEKQAIKAGQIKVTNKQTYKYVFNLFHIQQTDADIDAYIKQNDVQSNYSTEEKGQLLGLLKQKIEDNGTLIVERDLLRAKGTAQVRTDHVITLSTRNTLDENITVLLHEYAHDLLHHEKNSFSQRDEEVQAESISYMMSKFFGIENKSSFDYVQGWAGEQKEKSLSTNMKAIFDGFNKMKEQLQLVEGQKAVNETKVRQKTEQKTVLAHSSTLSHDLT